MRQDDLAAGGSFNLWGSVCVLWADTVTRDYYVDILLHDACRVTAIGMR